MPKPETKIDRVLLVLTVERTIDPADDEDEYGLYFDSTIDGLTSVDMDKAMNEVLQDWYQSDAKISIQDAVEVEPPTDRRRNPQFMMRGNNLRQTT